MNESYTYTPPGHEQPLPSRKDLLDELREVDPKFYDYHSQKGGWDKSTDQEIKHNILARREQIESDELKRNAFAEKYTPLVSFLNSRDPMRKAPLTPEESEFVSRYLKNAFNDYPSAGAGWLLPILHSSADGSISIARKVSVPVEQMLTVDEIRARYGDAAI